MKSVCILLCLILPLQFSPKSLWDSIFRDKTSEHPKEAARAAIEAPKAQIHSSFPSASPLASGKDTISLMLMGDMMMHTKQLSDDYTTFLRAIAPDMRAADLCAANFEFTLAGPPYSGYPCFSSPDGFAEHLVSDCGVDIILTANNHILDKGTSGFLRTLSVYSSLRDSLGISYTGSASSPEDQKLVYPLTRVCRGLRLAFVNFTYGTNAPQRSDFPSVFRMDSTSVRAAIMSAKQRGADFVVALPHWGAEYKLIHNEAQESWARSLVNWGADAVVGAHPHVVQDHGEIGGKPVFYSMGNVVSNMTAPNTQRGLVVVLRFEIDRATQTKRMLAPILRHTWCNLPHNNVEWRE